MSNYHDLNEDDLEDDGSLGVGQGEESESGPARTPSKLTRPPIVYSSPRAFAQSFGARWRSVWTRQFILALVAGQVVSLCITCTNVTTTELVNRGWTLSTTQGFFLCVNCHWSDRDWDADVFLLDTSRCSLHTHLIPYTNVRELYAF